MADLRTLLEGIDDIAAFAGVLEESRKRKAQRRVRQAARGKAASAERAAAEAGKQAREAAHLARRAPRAGGQERVRAARWAAEEAAKKAVAARQAAPEKKAKKKPTGGRAPEHALTRKQRKQAKTYEKHVAKEPKHRRRKGEHKFANVTTFRKVRGGSHDPGGAMASTPGLRRKLSEVPGRFLEFAGKKVKRGRYPIRVGNRASLGGTLRQASEREPSIYRRAVERIKTSPTNKMHRKKDPTTVQSNIERPVPFGGELPVRPHGEGGLKPDPGPRIKAPKKKAKGRQEKHELRREHGRKRAARDTFRRAVARARS